MRTFLKVAKWAVLAALLLSLFLDQVVDFLKDGSALAEWLKARKDALPPILAAVFGAIEAVASFVGDRKAKEELQALLDIVHTGYEKEGVESKLRATVFRYRRWTLRIAFSQRKKPHGRKTYRCRPLSAGWLVPECRSGDAERGSRTLFYCPPNENEEAEGFAGECRFHRGEAVVSKDLPEPKLSDEASIAKYASLAYVHPDWVRDRLKAKKPMSRDFRAIPIMIDGNIWGVLVLDAEKPDTFLKSKSVRCEQILLASLVAVARRL